MPSENCVLIAGDSAAPIQALVPFAKVLASEGTVTALGLVGVPAQESLSAGALQARRLRKEIEAQTRLPGLSVMVRVAHNTWRELRQVIVEEEPEMVLLDWKSAPPPDWLRDLPCDVAIIKPPFPKKSPRILLPIRGGPYAALALRLALAVAKAQQGEITVLHAAPAEQEDSYYRSFLQRLSLLPEVKRWIRPHGNVVRSITRAANSHDMVVMGAAARTLPIDPPVGVTAGQVLACSRGPAIVVKAGQPAHRRPIPEPSVQPVDFTISVLVDKWFAENTFHANEFHDIRRLVEQKERQGLTISLGLPTLNEEKTVGKIIKMMRTHLMQEFPLLDEIVVIDSNSTDRTVDIATGLGVPVVQHSDILPGCGTARGKGEALWKSLHVLRGDLIAWIDTDIGNIHPRFVYGILGPLICNPEMVYVKGFYQRPLQMGGKVEARGGGRVTELAARPLLNLFYPELSGFVQPLAGEYAGRRQALEQVPFFVGYGVETGLLIDLWSKFKLYRLGQVDLEERIHRNQSLIALSKMAFEIVQVVMQRVGTEKGIEMVNELNKSMKLIRYARDEFQLDIADIRAVERPPINSVAEYQEKRRHPRVLRREV
jgi:glycosyltransferase involved in cell wall biosynthesis